MSDRRPYTPLKVKLEVALRQLGLDPKTARLDHVPALARRKWQVVDGVVYYDPDANDPRYMQWLDDASHKTKTFGRGGEKRITTAGSDIGEITKTRHLTKKEQAFRARLLAKAEEPIRVLGQTDKPKIRSRGFDKNLKKRMDGKTERRT